MLLRMNPYNASLSNAATLRRTVAIVGLRLGEYRYILGLDDKVIHTIK